MVDSQGLQLILDQKKKIQAGDSGKVAQRHADGKRTARERISGLLDEGSFVETDALLSAGAVTGSGTIHDRPVFVIAQDFLFHGGAMGNAQAKKISKILDLAAGAGAPVLMLLDSAGVQVDEGAEAMNAFASILSRMVRLSGVCPMIGVLLGPVIGGAAMMAELCDLTVLVRKQGALSVYGPTVVGSLTGENLSLEEVGGAEAISAQGGASLIADSEDDAAAMISTLLDLLPSSGREYPEMIDTDDLNRVLTLNEEPAAEELLSQISDLGNYLELQQGYGKAIRIALARVGGHSCGLLVSDPSENEGMIDAQAAGKAARFIRFCDCFHLPLISLADSKGIAVPGKVKQVWTMRSVSGLLYAWADATCPKITVVTGKAIGQSYLAMGGKGNADMIYAWPGAMISPLTPDAAVQVLQADALKRGESRFELEAVFATETAGALAAAQKGLIDDIIDPTETRKYLINALEMLICKTEIPVDRKHGNMPM